MFLQSLIDLVVHPHRRRHYRSFKLANNVRLPNLAIFICSSIV